MNLHRDISLIGDLSNEQNARLMMVADRCPVHRTLHGLITVSTEQSSI
jgi:uncharacterized OsmC-like protein